MSKQVSQARVEANRRNAQHSTGPRTPEGKANSSRNALTHGLLSESSPSLSHPTDAAIGPITHPDHAVLLKALVADFHPSGAIEIALVSTLASLRHRLNRIIVIESGMFEESIANVLKYNPEFAGVGQETLEDCIAAPHPTLLGEAYGRQSRQLNLLSFYEARLTRSFHRTLTELRRTQALRLAAEGARYTTRQDAVPQAHAEKEQTNPNSTQPFEIVRTSDHNPPSPTEAASMPKASDHDTPAGSILNTNVPDDFAPNDNAQQETRLRA